MAQLSEERFTQTPVAEFVRIPTDTEIGAASLGCFAGKAAAWLGVAEMFQQSVGLLVKGTQVVG